MFTASFGHEGASNVSFQIIKFIHRYPNLWNGRKGDNFLLCLHIWFGQCLCPSAKDHQLKKFTHKRRDTKKSFYKGSTKIDIFESLVLTLEILKPTITKSKVLEHDHISLTQTWRTSIISSYRFSQIVKN